LKKEIVNNLFPSKVNATLSELIVNEENKICLIDSGAPTSFISEYYASLRNFKRFKIENKKNWVTANGAPIVTNGQTFLNIKIGDEIIKAKFVIAENLYYDVLIGLDIMRPNNFIIDYKDEKLIYKDKKSDLITQDVFKPNLVSSNIRIVIEPGGHFTYKHKVDPNLLENKLILVEKAGKAHALEGIATVGDNEINIILHNNSGMRQTINKHALIARISECEITNSIANLEELKKFIREGSDISYVNNISTDKVKEKPWKPSQKLKFNKNLSESQIANLKKLIDLYWMIFSKNDEDISSVADKFGCHDIEITNSKPIKQRPYTVPHAKETVVKECIDKMLKMNVIEPIASNWASPIVLVKKPDGSERFCVDFRKVNDITVKDCFPMPSIESKLNKLHGCKFFSSVDCTSGYWQIKMSERAKQITSFVCSRGSFCFNVMPFGLCNAGATFQRVVELIIADLKASTAYVDDILTASENFDEHLVHLEQLFIRLKDANMKVKTTKCTFAANETTFLGFTISEDGVKMKEDRIEAVKNYPRPKTPKQIKQFLGLAGYYRQFIRNFAEIVNPLNKLLKKELKFNWTDECENSFQVMIKLLSNPPILAFPDFTKPFHLATDASNVGIGAVLYQISSKGLEQVIYYASRTLNAAERNYSTIERELLAIVYSVEKFRYYLYGKEFIINTDHNPLTYLNNLTLSSSRLTRWRLKLAEYNFKILYKKGIINTNADAFSRIELPDNEKIHKEDLMEALLNINSREIEDKLIYHDMNILESEERFKAMCAPRNFKCNFGLLRNMLRLTGGVKQLRKQQMKIGDCIIRVVKGLQANLYLITKYKYTDSSSIEIFEESLKNLAKICKEKKIERIALPKAQSGLDKFKWSDVVVLLNKHIIAQGIECHIYTNQTNLALNSVSTEENLSINEKLKKLQVEDEKIRELKKLVENRKIKGYEIEEGVLLKIRKGKYGKIFKQILIPESLKKDIFELCHDNYTGAHLGEKKTWIKLSNRFYWPKSFQETKNYVNSCEVCAKLKNPLANRAELMPIIDFSKPFDMIAVDILELSRTSSGNKYVVVFSDYLTKWVEAFAMKDMKAETIAKIFINEIICRHSLPSKLLSDQGRNFLSNLIKSICEYFKINKVQTSPYNPKCDGLVERFNKTLCQMLAAYSDSNQTNWDLYLPLVLFAYRTSEQASSEASPFSLLYGREPRLGNLDNLNLGYEPSEFIKNLHERWNEAKRNILKHAVYNKKKYDSKYESPPPSYEVGDYVRIKQHLTPVGLKKKLRNNNWSELLEVNKVVSKQDIEIKLPNGKNKIINVNNAKPAEKKRMYSEVIKSTPTITKSGRVSMPRINT
jgi:hypothetical protein